MTNILTMINTKVSITQYLIHETENNLTQDL